MAAMNSTIDRPAAMRMWEWFDMRELLREMARTYPADALVMEGEDDDSEFHKHMVDAHTDHRHMSKEDSDARLKHVQSWMKEKGINPEAGLRKQRKAYKINPLSKSPPRGESDKTYQVHKERWIKGHRANGMDAKSMASADKVMEHPDFRAAIARSKGDLEPHEKATHGAEESEHLSKKAALLTGHGSYHSHYDEHQLAKAKKHLAARELHFRETNEKLVKAGKRPITHIPPMAEHGYGSISVDTGVSHQHLKNMAKGVDSVPIRNVIDQYRTKHDSNYEHYRGGKKKKGDESSVASKLGKFAGRELSSRGEREKHRATKEVDRYAAITAGGDGGTGGSRSIETKEGTLAHRVPHGKKTGVDPFLKHPGNKPPKGSNRKEEIRHGNEKARNEYLRSLLFPKRPSKERKGLGITPSRAVKTLTDRGMTDSLIGHLLNRSVGHVERIRHGGQEEPAITRRSTPKRKVQGGKAGGLINPELKKAIGKEQRGKKGEVSRKSFRDSVQKDLHRLYPINRENLKDMPPFLKRSDRPAKASEKVTEWGVPTSNPRGYAFSKSMKHPGEFDPKKHVPEGAIPAKNYSRVPEHKGEEHNEAHKLARAAHKAKRKAYEANSESILKPHREEHQKKIDAHHEALFKAHKGVHKVVNAIIDGAQDPNHPITKAHNEKEEKEFGSGGDLFDKHRAHITTDPEFQKALGINPSNKKATHHTSSAISNVMDRMTRHGTSLAAERLKRTGPPREARGSGPEGSAKRREMERPGPIGHALRPEKPASPGAAASRERERKQEFLRRSELTKPLLRKKTGPAASSFASKVRTTTVKLPAKPAEPEKTSTVSMHGVPTRITTKATSAQPAKKLQRLGVTPERKIASKMTLPARPREIGGRKKLTGPVRVVRLGGPKLSTPATAPLPKVSPTPAKRGSQELARLRGHTAQIKQSGEIARIKKEKMGDKKATGLDPVTITPEEKDPVQRAIQATKPSRSIPGVTRAVIGKKAIKQAFGSKVRKAPEKPKDRSFVSRMMARQQQKKEESVDLRRQPLYDSSEQSLFDRLITV